MPDQQFEEAAAAKRLSAEALFPIEAGCANDLGPFGDVCRDPLP